MGSLYAFSALRELGLLGLCLSLRSWSLSTWLRLAAGLAVVILAASIASFLGLAIRVLMTPRTLTCLPDSRQTVLGRPLLFSAAMTHTRVSPVKNRFRHRILFVGIPVGLRGRIGHLLSVDERRLAEAPECSGDLPSRQSVLSWFGSWFSFDPERYLHLGDNHLGLQEKLHRFLREQNEDPEQWPYAYLLSVPKFLWWSRSVVSWWYLYSPERELTAVVTELNNSFDEKRNFLVPVEKIFAAPVVEEQDVADHRASSTIFLSSSPEAATYRGSLAKTLFATPFDKVEGSISARFTDPLQNSSWSPTASLSITTATGPSGEPRLVTRISCQGQPLDPIRATWKEMAKFLLCWTMPGLQTTPRIIYQALRLQNWLRLMRMMDKPEIRAGSIPRHASRAEMILESFFRKYLEACVDSYPGSIKLTYIPSKAVSNSPILIQSTSEKGGCSVETHCLAIQPLDPGFYSRFANYADPWAGLSKELTPAGAEADEGASPILVSDPGLLEKLVSIRAAKKTEPFVPRTIFRAFVSWIRGPRFMDSFVSSAACPSLESAYFSALVRNWAFVQSSLGSLDLLDFYIFVGATVARLVSIELAAFVNKDVSGAYQRGITTAGLYLATVGCLSLCVSEF